MDALVSRNTVSNHISEEKKSDMLLELSLEIRLMIYSHALAPDPSNQEPALLRVLRSSKELSSDYPEALKIYDKLNVYVDIQTWNAFKALSWKSMLKLRHFKLRWSTTEEKRGLSLAGHRSTLRNNFESITFHIVLLEGREHLRFITPTAPLDYAQYLIRASTQPYTFVIKLELVPKTATSSAAADSIISEVNRALHVVGSKDGDESLDESVQVWTWGNNGKSLRWYGV